MLSSSKNMRQWLENVYKSGLPASQAKHSESWYFYDERPALPPALGCRATSLVWQTETEEDGRLNPFWENQFPGCNQWPGLSKIGKCICIQHMDKYSSL